MDRRTALAQGTRLDFPGLACVVEQEIGRGSNAIVYQGWYADAQADQRAHRVLIKELFPYHEEGAIRREAEGLLCLPEAQELWALHARSFEWGNQVHLALREKHPFSVGGNINTYAYNHTFYTILDYSGGRDLRQDEAQRAQQIPLRQIALRLIGVLDALQLFHEMGYLHLDVSPDNILLLDKDARERVELIDYNSVVSMADLAERRAVTLSAKNGYAAPEIRMQAMERIGPWTDLYAVAAVLFYCLMNRPLDRLQQSGLSPIDARESPALQPVPEMVKSKVYQILAKGLATAPGKRYACVEAMREDLAELIDRIDGVGVTHWALWETSRQNIVQEIKRNPALSYLTQESRLYPMQVSRPEGSSMEAFLSGRGHAVLSGSGGMGKTTLLMHMAYQECRSYRRSRPVVLYLSLYGWREGDAHFIHDSLLRRMKFKREMERYDSARHALDLLLQKPLQTKTGKVPTLCLLLDGYNEISGDTQALKQEIDALSRMEGVRLLITSRNALSEFEFEPWQMQPLSPEDVQTILGLNGLLLPEAAAMQQLLRNAMMLSLFVQACLHSGEQLAIQTREELISAYLDALLAKEVSTLPEDRKWPLQAAVRCVYPLLAHLEPGLNGAETQVKALYRALGCRGLRKLFPDWAGHTADIRADAADGDAWYGQQVHDLLWRRLGLLCQTETGAYRMAHQEFRSALAPKGAAIARVLRRRRQARALGGAGLLCIALFFALRLMETVTPHDLALKELQQIQQLLNDQHAAVRQVLSLADGAQDPSALFENARLALQPTAYERRLDTNLDGIIVEESTNYMRNLLGEAEGFAWGAAAFDDSRWREMAALLSENRADYLGDAENPGYIDVLQEALQNGAAEDYANCAALIGQILSADQRTAAACCGLLLGQGRESEYAQAQQDSLDARIALSEDAAYVKAKMRIMPFMVFASEDAEADGPKQRLLADWKQLLWDQEDLFSQENHAFELLLTFWQTGQWEDLVRAQMAARFTLDMVKERSGTTLAQTATEADCWAVYGAEGIDLFDVVDEYAIHLEYRAFQQNEDISDWDFYVSSLMDWFFDQNAAQALITSARADLEFNTHWLKRLYLMTNWMLLEMPDAEAKALRQWCLENVPVIMNTYVQPFQSEESILRELTVVNRYLERNNLSKKEEAITMANIAAENAADSLLLPIKGLPIVLPVPDGMNSKGFEYQYWRKDDQGNIDTAEKRTSFRGLPNRMQLVVYDTTLEEYQKYAMQLRNKGLKIMQIEDADIKFKVNDQTSLLILWEESKRTTTLLTIGEPLCFAPWWYAEAPAE